MSQYSSNYNLAQSKARLLREISRYRGRLAALPAVLDTPQLKRAETCFTRSLAKRERELKIIEGELWQRKATIK